MVEYVNLLSNYGVMIIIVALFIWDWISNKKDIKDSLTEMKKSNDNTSKSLELLRKSMENQEHIMQEHDKRSIDILNSIEVLKKGK